jgi:predicted nucleic acid-binding protein
MIAVDTNLLVYGHRRDSDWHGRAAALIRELAEGAGPWAIPWPCIHEFLSIVTHPRIYRPRCGRWSCGWDRRLCG